jgi:hypothetical protein
MQDDTRPIGGVAIPVDADSARLTGQQLGCLKAMTELLFAQLRRDLASVSDDPARAVERTVSAAEQRYRDCLEVYGAARSAPSHPELGPSSPPWGHPDVDGFDPCDPSGGAA